MPLSVYWYNIGSQIKGTSFNNSILRKLKKLPSNLKKSVALAGSINEKLTVKEKKPEKDHL